MAKSREKGEKQKLDEDNVDFSLKSLFVMAFDFHAIF